MSNGRLRDLANSVIVVDCNFFHEIENSINGNDQLQKEFCIVGRIVNTNDYMVMCDPFNISPEVLSEILCGGEELPQDMKIIFMAQ